MLKIIVFALVLVAIALSGAVSVASAETVPSPLQQVRDGVMASEIACSEDRVLMASPSGMPACVFVDSVSVLDKRGFVLLGETTPKAFPIRGDVSSSTMEPTPILSMSRLPNIGETALVEIRYTNWFDIDILDTDEFHGGFQTGWEVSPQFVIVNASGLLYDTVESRGVNPAEIEPQPGYSRYSAFTPLDSGETITYSLLIRAVSEGSGTIVAWGYGGSDTNIHLYVDNEETMPLWKHQQLYPEKYVRSVPPKSDEPTPPERMTEEEIQALEERMAAQDEPTREETVEWFTEYMIISGNSIDWAVTNLWHFGILNATETRTVLAGANFTDDEIDRAMTDNVANIP